MNGGGFLDLLVAAARQDVEVRRARVPLPAIRDLAERSRDLSQRCRDRPRGFRQALLAGPSGWVSIIAEIKRASPSRGVLMGGAVRPVDLALVYERNGARALSVVTESRFFRGDPEELPRVRKAVGLPVLRKDFVIDEYQVYQTAALGADAILLIAAVLPPPNLGDAHALARELGLDVLVEVHGEAELEAALAAGAELVGINNRDLRTFRTDLAVTERLAPLCPAGVTVVSESGVQDRGDVERLARAGARAVLVGEALLTAPDPGGRLRSFAAGTGR
ncbi:MAG: indole-3-glycerol phosphate synthase TrpC [Bacillota bacterium]